MQQSNPSRKNSIIGAVVVLALVGAFLAIYAVHANAGTGGQVGAHGVAVVTPVGTPTATRPPGDCSDPGSPVIGSKQVTSDCIEVTLLGVEKGPTRWLFHLTVRNEGRSAKQLLGPNLLISGSQHADQAKLDRQFVVDARTAAFPYDLRPLAQVTPQEATSHPALLATLPAAGTLDGWLAVDVTGLDKLPTQLLYYYDPARGMKCTVPSDQSTCSPEILYHALLWDL
jgi:hypothetical protein